VEADNQDKGTYWYRCSEILGLPRDAAAGAAINEYLRKRSLADHPHAFDTLFKLWSAVFQQRHLSYFTETAQSLDRVLDIFIRVNNQGQPLSKSDLLMSIATAQWKERDAREELPGTLREVNAVHPGFGFDRDHILKAGLVVAGISDVGFRAETLTAIICASLKRRGTTYRNACTELPNYSHRSDSHATISMLA
jgi:hypothetical protein